MSINPDLMDFICSVGKLVVIIGLIYFTSFVIILLLMFGPKGTHNDPL